MGEHAPDELALLVPMEADPPMGPALMEDELER